MQALSEVRTKVNGKFLQQYSGKPISILGQILKVHTNGSSFEMKSTDNQVINVILSDVLQEPLDGWVEVRGTAQGKTNVICNHFIQLPKEMTAKFSPEDLNELINVIHSFNNPWVSSD